MTLIWDMKNR